MAVKARFIAVDINEDLLFNTANQSPFFHSIKALYRGIDEVLDEPESEGEDGEVWTRRKNGENRSDFSIFKEV